MHDSQKIILFDGVCGLCNAWVDFILKRDRKKVFKFAPLQGDFAQCASPDASKRLHSVVYITGGKKYYRSGAALRILRDLGGAWTVFFIFWLLPFFIRDFFYTLIARFRYQLFGKSESCRLPLPEERDRFLD